MNKGDAISRCHKYSGDGNCNAMTTVCEKFIEGISEHVIARARARTSRHRKHMTRGCGDSRLVQARSDDQLNSHFCAQPLAFLRGKSREEDLRERYVRVCV